MSFWVSSSTRATKRVSLLCVFIIFSLMRGAVLDRGPTHRLLFDYKYLSTLPGTTWVRSLTHCPIFLGCMSFQRMLFTFLSLVCHIGTQKPFSQHFVPKWHTYNSAKLEISFD